LNNKFEQNQTSLWIKTTFRRITLDLLACYTEYSKMMNLELS